MINSPHLFIFLPRKKIFEGGIISRKALKHIYSPSGNDGFNSVIHNHFIFCLIQIFDMIWINHKRAMNSQKTVCF
jgi:hypothetical protein